MVEVPYLSEIYDKVVSIYDWVMSIYENMLWLVSFLKKIPEGIFDLMSKVVDFIEDIPGHIAQWVADLFTWVAAQLGNIVSWAGSSFSWFISQIPGPYMVVAPLVVICLLGVVYLLVRFAFWLYNQIPFIG